MLLFIVIINRKRAARTVLTGMCYSVGSATRQGSSSPTRFIGQSA
nr:sugar phosphate isomerase/epimerase [Escherichia coli]